MTSYRTHLKANNVLFNSSIFFFHYRHPCVAKVADYVLLLFIYLFFIFFLFTVRSQKLLDYHNIFKDYVFWCSSNSPIVLKFFWRHLAEINAKNSQNLVKISWVDSDFDNNFETVKDNSNLKQTWTMGIVSLHFWRISFRTVQGHLRSICPIGWENLYFVRLLYFHCSIKNYSTDLHKTSR